MNKLIRFVLSWFRGRPELLLSSPQPASTPAKSAPVKKILIIDDDPIILKTTAFKLQSQGYKAISAMDSSEAIAAVRDQHPDLILLDLNFPPDVAQGGRGSLDGIQLISWLRGFREAIDIPFIIISGSDPKTFSNPAMVSQAKAIFRKPIDHEALAVAIKRQLEKPT